MIDKKTIKISSEKGVSSSFSELINSYDLLKVFIWRDIKVRYKQTVLGVLWVILQPLFSMIIFTIFFGKLAKIPSGALPYTLFSLIGLTFWNLFSNSVSKASDSVVVNEGIVKKVYFPRLILPISAVLGSLIDFGLNLILLLILSIFLSYLPIPISIILIPLLALVTIGTALGLGLILSSINVRYRDVRYVLPFFIQISMFLVPVIYPLNIVDPANRMLMAFNPMTIVIETGRWLFVGGKFLYYDLVPISIISLSAMLIIGVLFFKKTEDVFTDVI